MILFGREIKKVFFVGIGGIGMSGLASIINSKGVEVLGSDKQKSSKTDELQKNGIKIFIGHSERNISADLDLLIFTNAIKEDNPEILAAKNLGIPMVSRAELLGEIEKRYFSIGIAGTHGKTTTTSIVSKILIDSGLDPTVSNGGNLPYLHGNYKIGNSKYLVYEACEAFESLLNFKPNIGVITNIDNDHIAEYYKTMDNLINAFSIYIKNVREEGKIIANGDDPNTEIAIKRSGRSSILTYGIRDTNILVADNIRIEKGNTNFDIYFNGNFVSKVKIIVPGLHNVYNSLATIAVGLSLGIDIYTITKSLSTFKNAERRFEVKFENKHITIIDDYGHHPTEIKATLTAAKNYGKRKVIALFQPHLWSRTMYLYKDFAQALNIADKIIITEVYGAREERISGISGEMIAKELTNNLKREDDVKFTLNEDQTLETLSKFIDSDCIVVVLGAGNINEIIPNLVKLVPV